MTEERETARAAWLADEIERMTARREKGVLSDNERLIVAQAQRLAFPGPEGTSPDPNADWLSRSPWAPLQSPHISRVQATAEKFDAYEKSQHPDDRRIAALIDILQASPGANRSDAYILLGRLVDPRSDQNPTASGDLSLEDQELLSRVKAQIGHEPSIRELAAFAAKWNEAHAAKSAAARETNRNAAERRNREKAAVLEGAKDILTCEPTPSSGWSPPKLAAEVWADWKADCKEFTHPVDRPPISKITILIRELIAAKDLILDTPHRSNR